MARLAISAACPTRLTRQDGARLRELIEAHWNDAQALELDFENLTIASASFFDESLGVLAMQHPLELLTKRVRPLNLTRPDRALLNRIVDRRSRERPT